MERLVEIARRRLYQHKLGEVTQASLVLFTAQQFFRHHFIDEPDSVRASKLQNATLWLEVKNGVVAQEVRGLQTKLLADLQSRYGKTLVKKIVTKDLTNS